MTPITPSVSFAPSGGNTVSVTWKYSTLYTEKQGNGMYTCFIPGFNITFAAVTKEMIEKKSQTMMKMLFDQFFIHQKSGTREVVLHLHKLGFKSNSHNYTVKQLIDNKPIKARFDNTFPISDRYKDSNSIGNESNMEVELV